jgi:hypothetical protein
MKKNIFGILVCMLFLTSGFSLSISAVTTIVNQKQFEKEYSTTSIDEPLEVRVEAEKVFDRIWIIKAFATNTHDTSVHIAWSNKPVTIAVFYLVPNEEKILIVNSPLGQRHFLRDKKFEFEPHEEKLIHWGLFYGISNWILYGFSNKYTQYIQSWPILPEGEYKVHASLNAYKMNKQWIPTYRMDEILFHYS